MFLRKYTHLSWRAWWEQNISRSDRLNLDNKYFIIWPPSPHLLKSTFNLRLDYIDKKECTLEER